MPATVNGIGTRYVGQKHAESRPAVCPHCRRNANLTSYDTRLWFVVFFIPVIPLARKRIIDQCSSCRRHYVVSLDEWEANKQLSISGAISEFREDPTPEKAIAAHQQLLGFHQGAQAEEFGKTMAERYPESANVQLYLGHASDHLGRTVRAREFFQRALALRPDLPEAKLAVAEDLIAQGKPEEARPLLDFLEQPGAARVYSPVPLERLGNAFQAKARHAEALELFAEVLREVPAAAQHAGFRKKVRQSEKALGQKESMLPKRRRSWRGIFSRGEARNRRGLLVAAVAVVLFLLGALGANFWTSRHRLVHAVNAYDQVATVQVDGQPPVQVPPHGETVLTVAEGAHRAVVSGPVHETVDFQIESDFFDRWFAHPAWVLNVGGDAVLLLQRVHYTRGDEVPADVSFFTGEKFRFFPDVDHAFDPLPTSVQLDENHREKVISGLSVFPVRAGTLVQNLLLGNQTEKAFDFCEARLRAFPDEAGLATLYLRTAIAARQLTRARETLRGGLTRRPVDTGWHRAYQTTVRLTTTDLADLQSEYDRLLAAAPDDSTLLYLRGRACEQPKEAEGYFTRAIAADPKNPWPLYASAYNHALDGDWAGARPLAERAVNLSPDAGEMSALLFETRLALGETAALETEARQSLRETPTDAEALLHLTDVLSATGQTEESRQALESWCAQVRQQSHGGEAAKAFVNRVRWYTLYTLGDFAGLEQETRAATTEDGQSARLQALVELGKLDEAAKWLAHHSLGEDKPVYLLALSVAAAAKGETGLAEDSRQSARKAFEQLKAVGAGAVALLARTTPPTLADFDAFNLDLDGKRLLLASGALQFPGREADAARLSRTLNVSRVFPYHLLRRVTPDANGK